jgi:hypothetical protein
VRRASARTHEALAEAIGQALGLLLLLMRLAGFATVAIFLLMEELPSSIFMKTAVEDLASKMNRSFSEEPVGASMSVHHYFTCPETLEARARFVYVGMRVRGRDVEGVWVMGEVIAGHWRTVMLRDEEGKEHPGVEVRTLEVLTA